VPLDSHTSSQLDYALLEIMLEGGAPGPHTLDNTFWPVMSISGLDYTPVEFDELTEHDPIASAATTLDAPDVSYWDAVLSSPSFNASSFAESFDSAFVPLSPVLAFRNFTPGTPSSPATAASAEGSDDTVICQWSGCGAVVQQQSVWQHLTDTHGHEIPSKSKTLQACRWTDCTAEFHELRPHVRLHYGVDVHCDACGEVFARDDAVRRHKANGACRKCPWCRVRFETVEEKVAHVAKCLRLDVNTKAGRERTVGKIGSVARQAAHPYKN
jgi:hypothetical protein